MRLAAWAGLVVLAFGTVAAAAELATFQISEPLGLDWPDEWLEHEAPLALGGSVRAGDLRLIAPGAGRGDPQRPERAEAVLPAQFYWNGRLLADGDALSGKGTLKVLFKASLRKNQTARFRVIADPARPRAPERVDIYDKKDGTWVASGLYELNFDGSKPLPINRMRTGSAKDTLGRFKWPAGIAPTGVQDEWIERGPARVILKRTFEFKAPALKYEITLDMRAGDPWIDITDTYALGKGTFLELDLGGLRADVVYHPHTYNARTFKPGGKAEDSTLQPPQHPIATLGPIWRDIWFGGGLFAFIYKSGADHGVGIATVRGSQWDAPEGVSLESQNLYVNGDRETEGRVWVKIPTDAGHRRWAVVLGPPEMRKRMGGLVRSHADTPLRKVLSEWILDWESDAPAYGFGLWTQWMSYFNQHSLNPTTFPRRVKPPRGPVKSRDLAAIAYQFSNPDYWPGPKYKWRIGNPNFHTDMYNIPLKIGLAMPDHPHAKRWVRYGVDETKGNLNRDSYPGGAWAESLSYSGAFFHIVDYGRRLRDAGVLDPFKEWPRYKEVATYLAMMHTPTDPRYGSRQKAPIGDTSPGNYIRNLRGMAGLYRGLDDKFAEQLARFPEKWDGALDLSSREFFGFGAMLRGHAYDDRHESFVTVKAGPARNHFQGDELSFFFAGLGTPLCIDYACHYSPRPWSAAMHNRPDMNGKRPAAVAARRAFKKSDVADVFVADERTRRINEVPLVPHHTTKPGWEYPWTTLPQDKAWTMRRFVMLVKHDPAKSKIPDYLVVRDEIASPEPIWWNLHVLARDIKHDGPQFFFPGQLDVDLTVHFHDLKGRPFETREWGWGAGDSGSRRTTKFEQYERTNFGAYIPKDFKRGTWRGGEMAKWLRIRDDAGRSRWLVLLIPHRRGQPAPKVTWHSDTCARVWLDHASEVVHLGSDGKYQAAVERDGKVTELLAPGKIKSWAELDFRPIPPGIDQGAL